ncbi:hypothetical protein NCLIV_068340 [Neospora caninum Liverpool]|nr:hypothetical protein NCLIV_068340 [Neospora caninum Liverpool]CBZ56410.1 hypothetical protein NCLIV_068340 [Neospora caninum Liverpool]|eukprot:XP_003886435.1 hypothetical protein NCLIV_068340 [Neospora caninum Liverpool]
MLALSPPGSEEAAWSTVRADEHLDEKKTSSQKYSHPASSASPSCASAVSSSPLSALRANASSASSVPSFSPLSPASLWYRPDRPPDPSLLCPLWPSFAFPSALPLHSTALKRRGTHMLRKQSVVLVCAYLRLAVDLAHDASFLRVLNRPKRGLGLALVRALCRCLESLEGKPEAGRGGEPGEDAEDEEGGRTGKGGQRKKREREASRPQERGESDELGDEDDGDGEAGGARGKQAGGKNLVSWDAKWREGPLEGVDRLRRTERRLYGADQDARVFSLFEAACLIAGLDKPTQEGDRKGVLKGEDKRREGQDGPSLLSRTNEGADKSDSCQGTGPRPTASSRSPSSSPGGNSASRRLPRETDKPSSWSASLVKQAKCPASAVVRLRRFLEQLRELRSLTQQPSAGAGDVVLFILKALGVEAFLAGVSEEETASEKTERETVRETAKKGRKKAARTGEARGDGIGDSNERSGGLLECDDGERDAKASAAKAADASSLSNKLEDVWALLRLAEGYTPNALQPTGWDCVWRFLKDLANDRCGEGEKARKNTIFLSTIHQAKGLEWPVVILAKANEGHLPLSSEDASGSFVCLPPRPRPPPRVPLPSSASSNPSLPTAFCCPSRASSSALPAACAPSSSVTSCASSSSSSFLCVPPPSVAVPAPVPFSSSSVALSAEARKKRSLQEERAWATMIEKKKVEERELHEERRLCYVAMTRAKTQLLVTASKTEKSGQSLRLSRFVSEAKLFHFHSLSAGGLQPKRERGDTPGRAAARSGDSGDQRPEGGRTLMDENRNWKEERERRRNPESSRAEEARETEDEGEGSGKAENSTGERGCVSEGGTTAKRGESELDREKKHKRKSQASEEDAVEIDTDIRDLLERSSPPTRTGMWGRLLEEKRKGRQTLTSLACLSSSSISSTGSASSAPSPCHSRSVVSLESLVPAASSLASSDAAVGRRLSAGGSDASRSPLLRARETGGGLRLGKAETEKKGEREKDEWRRGRSQAEASACPEFSAAAAEGGGAEGREAEETQNEDKHTTRGVLPLTTAAEEIITLESDFEYEVDAAESSQEKGKETETQGLAPLESCCFAHARGRQDAVESLQDRETNEGADRGENARQEDARQGQREGKESKEDKEKASGRERQASKNDQARRSRKTAPEVGADYICIDEDRDRSQGEDAEADHETETRQARLAKAETTVEDFEREADGFESPRGEDAAVGSADENEECGVRRETKTFFHSAQDLAKRVARSSRLSGGSAGIELPPPQGHDLRTPSKPHVDPSIVPSPCSSGASSANLDASSRRLGSAGGTVRPWRRLLLKK